MELIENATLKTYSGAAAELVATHREQFNAAVSTFIKA